MHFPSYSRSNTGTAAGHTGVFRSFMGASEATGFGIGSVGSEGHFCISCCECHGVHTSWSVSNLRNKALGGG